MSHLALSGITKTFGTVRAVNNISLNIAEGECLALLGPSGCGKTTLLRMIAGLEAPDSGQILLAGKDITSLPAEARNTGLVFQNYALFPHLSVAENVAFGLEARKRPKQLIAEKVSEALALVQLQGYGGRKIQELSGGQQQRVAIARALAIEPALLLLDEPLSNLDAALRESTARQLRALIDRLRVTTVFVTHDQEDAFAIADRVALVNAGSLQQTGTPQQLYFHPANSFVAGFIGRSNLIPGRRCGAANGNTEFDISGKFRLLAAGTFRSDQDVLLRIRPEAIRLMSAQEAGIKARVQSVRFAGATIHYRLDVCGVAIDAVMLTPATDEIRVEGECTIVVPPEAVAVLEE